MKNSIVIGINWEQNSTAALMLNGKIIACVSEERFSRVKNDERYPINALNWIIKEYKIKIKDIEAICVISDNWTPGYILTRHYTKFSIEDYIAEQNLIWYPRIYKKKKVSQIKIFKNKLNLKQFPGITYWKKIAKFLKDTNDHTSNKNLVEYGKKIRSEVIKKHLNIDEKKIKFIDHSTGHANFSFFSRNYKTKKSLVLTLDAFGDNVNYSAKIYSIDKDRLKIKNLVKGNTFIIGRLYRYVTLILGFKPNEHEYKVMGLAPYAKGKYAEKVKKVFQKYQYVKGLSFKFRKKPKDLYFQVKNELKYFRFDNIAAGLQLYTEELILKWIKNLINKNKIFYICLAGGVAMNVKNNMLISSLDKKINLYVPPSPDDSSQAMGACYSYQVEKYGNKAHKHCKPLTDAYLGPEENIDRMYKIIKKKLKKDKFKIIKKNINLNAAKLIAKNKILGRYCGRAEFGARALGNRSILANPSNIIVKDKINETIKNRDFWMPFAASVIKSKYKNYFGKNLIVNNYNYMTNCTNTLGKSNHLLSASIHPYDKTCRPQIISKNQNKNYEDLISKFGKITGIYALLNTSFNLHGYPIVNSIEDAIDILIKSNLDGLITEKFLVIKK